MFPGAGQPANGGSQIGDQMAFMDVGTFYTAPNGEVWLRTGTWVSPASAPDAAKIPYLQATGVATGVLPAALVSSAFDMATDNAGRWVIAYGNTTNVMVSTDNGATWSLVAHNAGGNVVSVCFTTIGGGLFIAGGNSATTFFTSSVAAASVGSGWTARTGTTITGGTGDTARVRSSGAEIVMVCGSGTTGNASRSTNGTSWTAANLAVAMSSQNDANGLTSLGGGVWITTNSSGSSNRSTDGGATWASVTYPASLFCAAFGGGQLLAFGGGNAYTSTTGATGSFTNLGKLLGAYDVFGSNFGLSIQHNGTVFVASVLNSAPIGALGFYATSTDGVSWALKTAIGRSWADAGSAVPAAMVVATNGDYVMSPCRTNHSGTIIRGNLNTVTGVGFNVVRPASASYPAAAMYVRIA